MLTVDYDKKTADWWLSAAIILLFLSFPTSLGVANFLAPLLFFALALRLDKKVSLDIFKQLPSLWVLSAIFFMIAMGSIYSTAGWSWISLHFSKYAKIVYAITIALYLAKNENLQRLAIRAFILAMLFILASTYLNIWFQLPWSASQNVGWGKNHYVIGDHITQNIMMTFAAIIFLQKSFKANKIFHKTVFGILYFLSALSITHLSESRTGTLLLVIGTITFLFLRLKGSRLLISLFFTILIGGTLLLSSEIQQSRIKQAITETDQHEVNNQSSIGHRLYNYKITPKLVLEAPIFGHGTGAYHTKICEHLKTQEDCRTYSWHPHNQFLFYGVDHGLLGLLLYCGFIFTLMKAVRRSKNDDARVLLGCFTALLLFDSLINSPLFSSRESHFFLFMAALLLSMSLNTEDSNNELKS